MRDVVDRCDVCGKPALGGLILGDEDGELRLCESCSAAAFPGLSDAMRCSCPICSGQDLARFN